MNPYSLEKAAIPLYAITDPADRDYSAVPVLTLNKSPSIPYKMLVVELME
jgi:hypothetical protein